MPKEPRQGDPRKDLEAKASGSRTTERAANERPIDFDDEYRWLLDRLTVIKTALDMVASEVAALEALAYDDLVARASASVPA